MLSARRSEFGWCAEIKTSATPLVRMVVFQQREGADTLKDVVTPAIFRLRVMNRWARNISFPLRGGSVEATGKEFGQR